MKLYKSFGAFLVLCLLSLMIGSKSLSAGESPLMIMLYSRLPRTISAVLVGASMSLAGLLMQSISNNNFASPSTVGTVEAAKLGLIVSLLLPTSDSFQKILFSFSSAFIFTLTFLSIIRRLKIKKNWSVPLYGIIYGQLLNGIGQALAYRFQLSQNIASWSQGSFATSQTGHYEWLYLNLLTIICSYLLIHRLSIIRVGEDFATNLGINYQLTWAIVIVCVSLSTAVNVIVVGTLPFIGIIIPNLVRLKHGDLLRHSMKDVMIFGASFVLICDILARLIIQPFEVPVGIIISLIGSVVFIFILMRGRQSV